jgi:hypothetical protein
MRRSRGSKYAAPGGGPTKLSFNLHCCARGASPPRRRVFAYAGAMCRSLLRRAGPDLPKGPAFAGRIRSTLTGIAKTWDGQCRRLQRFRERAIPRRRRAQALLGHQFGCGSYLPPRLAVPRAISARRCHDARAAARIAGVEAADEALAGCGSDPVAWLRYDPTPLWRDHHRARRKACRPSHGPQQFHPLRRRSRMLGDRCDGGHSVHK